MASTMEWPTRERILEVFDTRAALGDVLADVDAQAVASGMSSDSFPAPARKELGLLIGMKNLSRPSVEIAKRILTTIARTRNVGALRPLLFGWIDAFNQPSTPEQWAAFLGGQDDAIMVSLRKGNPVPIAELLLHHNEPHPDLRRAGLLAAVTFADNPLPPLVLLAAEYEPAAAAVSSLASEFKDVPQRAAWFFGASSEARSTPELEGKPSASVVAAAEQSTPPDSTSLQDRLAMAEALLSEAVDLANRLQSSAELISVGKPQVAIANELGDWTSRAIALVGPDGDIKAYADDRRLEISSAEAAAEEARALAATLEDLLRKIAGLEALGTPDLIPVLLSNTRFKSAADVEAALAEMGRADRHPTDKDSLPDELASNTSDAVPDEPGNATVREPSGEFDLPDSLVATHEHPAAGADESVPDESEFVEDEEPKRSTAPLTQTPAAEQSPRTDDEPPVTIPSPAILDGENQPAAEDTGAPPPDIATPMLADQPDHVPVLDAGNLPLDPWRAPTPPLHCQLIEEGRDGLALLIARHREPDSPRTKALAVFTAAFGIRAERVMPSLPDFAPDAGEIGTLQMDEAQVLLAAQLRLALELGYSPIGSLESLSEQAGFDGHVGETVDAAVELAKRGYRRRSDATAINLPAEWREISDAAEVLRTTLSTRSLSYQRSSKIIHFLVRDNQPLGRALVTLIALADAHAQGTRGPAEDWTELAEVAARLGRQDGPARLINDADQQVSTSQQRRNPIVADANARLHDAVADVVALLERALELKRAHDNTVEANPGVDDTRLLALVSQAEVSPSTTAGQAAAARLLKWIAEPTLDPGSRFSTLRDLLDTTMSPLYEIPRGADGRTNRHPEEHELAQLITGRDPHDVVRGYLTSGNRAAAIAFRTTHLEDIDEAIDDEIKRSLATLRQRHYQAVVRADGVIARLRSLGEDEVARDLLSRIDEFRLPVEDRFDLSLNPLAATSDEGEAALASVRSELRRRAEALAQADRARILSLLDADNEPLAVEYLTIAESGEPLPSIEPPSGDDFAAFFPAFVELATTHEAPASGTVARVRESLGLAVRPDNAVLAEGIKRWAELAKYRQGGSPAQLTERISYTLRMLGLIPPADPRIRPLTKNPRAGYATFSVRATPIGDGSYVPSHGSQAQGSYHLTLVWQERVSPARLLQLVDEDYRSKANVILYFGTLTVEQRHELRRLTARAGTDYSPIVVDDAVVAWLSTQSEAGWKVTQRVTLPFTTINPYTPFAGGEVPAEMFVGREVERRQIVDPTGPMFVYGGRQLGKSALLRRIERGAAGADDNVVVYIDLKAAGVGESSPASALWQAVAPRLLDAGVLKKQRTWTADSVTSGIAEWLKADESRRCLLLLDEADNFLTTDAREKGATGLGSFPTLQRLKGLMEQSARRFKPVFAGLHQVQRFHALPNTPVAHGGQDILVGPLRPVDAQQLVRDPLLALGYRFDNDDTMWRLLLFTNNQASLIQIMCEALIRHVRTLPLPPEGGRVVITDQHVGEVYATREVRELIAQRFRWTINLDSRYRMIALVTAFRSFDAAPGETFSAAELQRECEDYWPDGFSKANLSTAEFLRYLEEMTGLGVLHRQGDEFGLRSPNIRSLLGTRSDIEEELIDASRTFEVAYEYNPAANRRQLSETATTDRRRSPLPDSDLAELVKGTHIVVGTDALGLDRVVAAIELVTRERQFDLLRHFPANDQPGRVHVLEVSGAAELLETYQRASRMNSACVLVATPDAAGPNYAEVESAIIQLRRWSLSALQAWPETPFETSALRRQLREVTGGWPSLVEAAMECVDAGATPNDALLKVEQCLGDPGFASEFVRKVGVQQAVFQPWLEWFADFEDGKLIQVHSVQPADLDAAGVPGPAREVLRDLVLKDALEEVPDGWVMDSALLRAARTIVSTA